MAVTDEAITAIKEMIASRRIGPGDRLPPEFDLSETLGVSRNSLREAVKALEVAGVLSVRRGDGTYVTDLSPRRLLTPLRTAVELLTESELSSVRRTTRILAAHSAAAAVGRATPEMLDDLERTARAFDAASHGALRTELAEHFVHGLALAGDDAFLAELMRHLIRARTPQRSHADSSGVHHQAEHMPLVAVVQAIRDGDRELAPALMTAVLASAD